MGRKTNLAWRGAGRVLSLCLTVFTAMWTAQAAPPPPAQISYTVSGTFSLVSGVDPAQLAGQSFEIDGTLAANTPPASTGPGSATYTFPSITLTMGNFALPLSNVPITFTIGAGGVPTITLATSIHVVIPIPFSASIAIPVGSMTTPSPTGFGTVAITPDQVLSAVTYGQGVDTTVLAVTGTVSANVIGPTLVANPSSLAFGLLVGGPNPPPQTFQVTAGSVMPISVTSDPLASWLSITSADPSTPSVVTVAVDPTNLAPGTYNTQITITAAGANNSPLTVPVQFVVSNQPPPGSANQFPPLTRGEFTEVAPQGFGDRQNGWAWSMEWFKDKLYVGTNRAFHCVEDYAIHRVLPNYQPYPPKDTDISCAADFNDLPLQAEIWAWSPDTNTWTRAYQSPLIIPNPDSDKPSNKLLPPELGFRGLQLYTESDGTQAMYISGVNSKAIHPVTGPTGIPAVPGARMLRTVDGVHFNPIATPETAPNSILVTGNFASFRGMTVYNGCLYVVAGTLQGAGVILGSCNPSDPNSWAQVSPQGLQYYEVGVYNNFLWATQSDHLGFSVVKSDGSDFPNLQFTTVIPNDGYRKLFPNVDGLSLKEFNGDLYVGGDGIHSFFGAEMFRVHPDDTWDLVSGIPRNTPDGFKAPISGLGPGLGWILNAHMWRMEVFDNRLYVGTFDLSTTFRNIPFVSQLVTPELGFDLWWTQDGTHWFQIDQNGFGDKFNFGVRSLKKTDWGLFLGTANYFHGLRIYRGIPAGFNFPPVVNPNAPVFTTPVYSTTPMTQTLQVSSVSLPTTFNVTSSVTTPPSGNWLKISSNSMTPPVGPGSTPLVVTADPTGLAVGTYTGIITFNSPTTGVQRQITVTLNIIPYGPLNVGVSQLQFAYSLGGPLPATIGLPVSTVGPPMAFTVTANSSNSVVNGLTAKAANAGWLSVNTGTGTAPNFPQQDLVLVSADPGKLGPGRYTGTLTIASPYSANGNQTVSVSLLITPASSGPGTVTPPPVTAPGIVSQVLNGQGWQTSLLMLNTTTKPQPVSLNFWNYDGSALTLPLVTAGPETVFSSTIPVGGLSVAQTDGSGISAQQGWAALGASGVGGSALLTSQVGIQPPSEVALPLNSNASQKLVMPFDETLSGSQYTTTLALANAGTAPAVGVLTFVDDAGQAIPITGTINVPANGHYTGDIGAMFPPLQGKRGLLQVTSTAGLSGVGYRFNGAAYTALPVLANASSGAKTIPHLVNGAGWKSTILLVNPGAQPASFSINFYAADGSALTLPLGVDGNNSTISGSIAPGQMRIIQTDGSGSSAVEGSASVSSSAPLGGTAIFTAPPAVGSQAPSEAASPLVSTLGTTLDFPFDLTNTGLGLSTTIELANPGSSPAKVTLSFTDPTGQAFSGSALVTIPAHGHYESVLGSAFPSLQGSKGVVQVKSTLPLTGLAIRYNGLAFTSIPAVVPGAN